MVRPSLLTLLCAALLPVSAQTISLSNGVHLRIATTFPQGNSPETITATLAPASGDSFYHIFHDQTGLAVYAYELAVTRVGEGSDFNLTERPAGEAFAKAFHDADGGKPVPTIPEDRTLPALHPGGQTQISVFSLPGDTGAVIDTVSLDIGPNSGLSSGNRIRFDGIRVYVNKTLSPGPTGISVTGRFAMFYIPGMGGYFFATTPTPGFLQAGWVDRSRMQFTLDNLTFDCLSQRPILIGSERGEIYAYHDPNYKPVGNWTLPLDSPAASNQDFFFTAAADTLSWWLR